MPEPKTPPSIDLVIETRADPETAWRTLTEPDRVVLWFTDASPLGPVGSPYRLDFGEGSVVAGHVVGLEPGRGFAHTWVWEDAGPGQPTTVAWTIEPLAGGGCRIRLVHAGWSEGEETARDDHEAYWTGYLDDLSDILAEA